MSTLKNIMLCIVIVCGSSQLLGMEEPQDASDARQITLELQDGTVVALDKNLIELSVTLNNVLKDCEEIQETIPLPNITQEQWNILQPLLSLVYNEQFEGLKAAIKTLTNNQIIQLLNIVNYLDIPALMGIAIKVLAQRIEVDDIKDAEDLPIELVRSLLQQRMINEEISINTTNGPLAVVAGHTGAILSLHPLHTDQGWRIISRGFDGTARILDLEGKQLATCKCTTEHVRSVCAIETEQGWKVVMGSNDGMISLYDLEGNICREWQGHTSFISALYIIKTEQGSRIISASQKNEIHIWNLDGNQLAACNGSVIQIIQTDQGWRIISHFGNQIDILDLEGNKIATCQSPTNYFRLVHMIEMEEDWKIISMSYDDTVCIWNLAGHLLDTFKLKSGSSGFRRIEHIIKTPEGWRIVVIADFLCIYIFDLEGNQIAVCQGHEEPIKSVHTVEAHEGWRIISSSDDGTVRVWDFYGNQLAAFKGYAIDVVQTPEGPKIISVSYEKRSFFSGSYNDSTIRIFDLSGNQLAEYKGNKQPSAFCTIKVDTGLRIISGSQDGVIRIWDGDPLWKKLHTIDITQALAILNVLKSKKNKKTQCEAIQKIVHSTLPTESFMPSPNNTNTLLQLGLGGVCVVLIGYSVYKFFYK